MANGSLKQNNPSGLDTGMGCSWDYDRYGNRWHQNTYNESCTTPMFTFSGNNNRIDGYGYDAAGNMLYDGVHHYTYDAENRLLTVDGGASSYVYDTSGQRVRKTVGSVSVDYLYDLASQEITEVNSASGMNRGEVYASGRQHKPVLFAAGVHSDLRCQWESADRQLPYLYLGRGKQDDLA